MVTPLDILEPGGTLIVASACSEGFGSDEFRAAQQRLAHARSRTRSCSRLLAKRFADVDEWQTEMQLKSMRVGRVQLYTTGLDAEERSLTGVETVDSIDAALAAALAARRRSCRGGGARRTLCRPGRRLTRHCCLRRTRSRSTSISSAASAATCSSPRWSMRCRRSPAPVLAELAAMRAAGESAPEFGETSSGGLRARRFGLAPASLSIRPSAAISVIAGAAHEDAGTPYASLRRRIVDAPLSPPTREHALALLALLADAEAQVHGIPVDEVHFHELADWDSLLDVVAAGCIAARLDGAHWTASSLPLWGRHRAHGARAVAGAGARDEPAAGGLSVARRRHRRRARDAHGRRDPAASRSRGAVQLRGARPAAC